MTGKETINLQLFEDFPLIRSCRVLIILVSIIGSSFVAARETKTHRIDTRASIIGNYQESGETWLSGGLGRYGYGEDRYDSSVWMEVDVSYQYRPSAAFLLSAHVQGQGGRHDSSARHLGLIELEARYRYAIDFNQQVSLKAGQFFLPTSMENIDQFWDSPYTISFSSLNSWIGEEFRPIGLDTSYRYHFDRGDELSVAATIFGGNDSMGALLAFRGWSYGRQRTVLGDVLALPELNSLQDDQMFGGQRDDGTKPFGRDLDDRPGYAVRTSLALENLILSLAWVDNQGDTTLLHAEYAWRTHFSLLGAAWQVSENLEVLGEVMQGNTTMGAGPGVDVDFYSTYVLVSYLLADYGLHDWRLTYRYDQFGIDDRDAVDQESNEFGRSHTLAVMWQGEDSDWRLGAEALYLDSKRVRILSAEVPNRDEESISLSLLAQYSF